MHWDWFSITMNPNLTIEFVLKFRYKDFDWRRLTLLDIVTKEIIYEKEDDWSLGYDISIKAYISKLGHVEEEEYLLQYINHIYQMDKVYAVYA